MNLKEHLLSRHCNLELHRPVLNEEECTATFYLWNLSGKLVGYQQYKPLGDKKTPNNPKDGKYFTMRKSPTLAVFGVESLHLSKTVFLTEGVFDACRLTNLGYSALAVLSNDQKPELRDWLLSLNRKVVAVCDNDSAGKRLAKFGTHAVFTEDHDLGDSSQEYVNNLVKHWS